MKLFSFKNQLMASSVVALSLVFVLAGAGIAEAAITLSSTAVTSDAVLTLNGGASSANTLFAATTDGSITVGAGLTTGTYTVGNATQTGAVVIRGAITGGANTLFNNSTTSTIAIGGALTSGTLTLGNAAATGITVINGSTLAGTNSLFGNATTSTIAIGAALTTGTLTLGGGGANVVTIGDVTGATSGTTLIGGSLTLDGPVNYGVDAGASDTYVVTLSPAPTAYVAGMLISFTVNTANTGAATINVNGLGAVSLVKGANAALADNDLIVNRTYLAVYDGTRFDVINPAAQ
jgi:hypothetical protein